MPTTDAPQEKAPPPAPPAADKEAPAAGGKRRHRGFIATAFVLATIIGFFACFAVWVNRQLLNTGNWTKTSSDLIANEQIQEALSTYAVNELFASVNVEQTIKERLPSEIQGVAGPAAAGLKQLGYRVVPQLLATAPIQEAWRHANQVAHAELLHILNGGGKVVSTKSGVVSLNLHELVNQLAGQLGVQSQVAAVRSHLQGSSGAAARATAQERLGITLPPTTGELVIMRSSQLKTAQDIVKAIKGLAIVLPVVAILLFALAIWLSTGRRRVALRTTGWCLFGIGLVLLIARRIAGDAVVNGLVKVPANRPAMHSAWAIATSLLYDIAIAMVIYGLVVVAAAWLAGRTRPATFLRHALAPFSRDHTTALYAIGAGILLLIVLWGPTPATRQIIPVIGLFLLCGFGLTLLRRQAAIEFPNATSEETVATLRHAWASARGRAGAAVHGGDGARQAPAGAGENSRFEALERISNLHERGALTDEEFAAEKSRVLAEK